MSIIIDGQSLRNHINFLRRQTSLLNKKIENLSPASGVGSGGIMPAPSSQGANISIANLPVKDEDNMASNSDVHLATQQSIKAYVDSQVDTVDTLSEILAIGNTTGGTKIEVDNTSGGIDFIDNAKLRLGTGDDNLEIYQDGTNSFIQVRDPLINSTAGTLYINAPIVDIGLDADTTESGDVKLRNVSVFTGSVIKDEDNMASNSSSHLATQQSIKAYVDTNFFENGDVSGHYYLTNPNDTGSINFRIKDNSSNTLLPLLLDYTGFDVRTTLTVGVDDTGHDVKFFGATSGKYMLWDESADSLKLTDTTNLDAGTGLRLYTDANGHAVIYALGQDKDLYLVGDDGGTGINALVFDMSDHGKASFNGQVNIGNPGYTSSNPDGYMKGAGNNGTAGSRFQVTANSSDNTRRLWLGTSHTEAAITITENKVGIGTTTLIPAATLLHLFDSAPELRIQDGGDKASNASGYLSFYDHDSLMMNFGVNDGGGAELNLVNNAAFTFKTNNSVALTLNASQNATFAGTVQVDGSNVTVINASDPNITVSDDDTNYRGSMRWLTSSNVLEFFTRYAGTYYTNNLVLDRGKVGIGTTSPAGLLTINGTGDAIRVESTNAGAGGAQVDLLHFTASPADEDIHASINMGGYYTGTTSVYGTQIKSIWTDVSERHSRLEFTTCDTTVSTALTLAHDNSATFAGDIILAQTASQSSDIKGDRTDSQLTIKGGSAGAGVQLFGSTYTNYAGAIYLDATASSTGTNDAKIIMRTGSSPTTALTLDRSQNATFTGRVTTAGEIINAFGSAVSVGQSATTIAGTSSYGALAMVWVNYSGAIAHDLVSYSLSDVDVIASQTISGGPAGRTYSAAGGVLKVAMGGSDTYNVYVSEIRVATS